MEDANFEDLLIKDSFWTIHENNIHTLLTSIYKSLNHISPLIIQEFFDLKVTPYSLRRNNLLRLPKINTSRYGTQASRCGTQASQYGTQALCFKYFTIWYASTMF